MSSLDGAFSSLMQGVSQQTSRERLPGQLSSQVNMLSDLVRGLRRRPGMRWLSNVAHNGNDSLVQHTHALGVDVGDTPVHVMINTNTGRLRVFSMDWNVLKDQTLSYLVASSAASIQTATLRGELFIANTEQLPTKVVSNAGKQDPALTGFYFISSSAYSKVFNLTITVNGTAYNGTYTVPDGSSPSHAAQATPEYIATQLGTNIRTVGLLPTSVQLYQTGAYVFVQSTVGPISITSDSGQTYIVCSGASRVPTTAQLPARLATQANGMLMSVGASSKVAVWYQWSSVEGAWNEVGAWNSASGLANMPIALSLDGSYNVDTSDYEGRLAGTDDSNEDPEFLTTGITGLSAFQGRLIILAGPNVVASASGKPRRYYRSTITDLLVVDPFSIYSGAATTTNFSRAVPFNKDLLLFSPSCQAVVPAGNSAITSTVAQIVITSAYSSTVQANPIVTGRSLLYYTPRSEGFAGALEMVPSNNTDSQYTSNDATAHLPTYFPGNVVQATASTTSNQLALLVDGDRRSLYLQDYLWTDEGKKQAAWHRWTAPMDISAVWFVRDTVYVAMTAVLNTTVIVEISPEAGLTFAGGLYRRPYSDVYTVVTVSNGTFTVPSQLRVNLVGGASALLTIAPANNSDAGEAVGFSIDQSTWTGTVVRNVPDGVYCFGLVYESSWSPTPPMMRDQQGTVIGTARTLLTRYELTTENVGEFNVEVRWQDRVLEDGTYSAIRWSSDQLLPNYPIVDGLSKVVIPVRAVAQDTEVLFSCDTEHDLNCLTLEYVLQYNQRRRRAT